MQIHIHNIYCSLGRVCFTGSESSHVVYIQKQHETKLGDNGAKAIRDSRNNKKTSPNERDQLKYQWIQDKKTKEAYKYIRPKTKDQLSFTEQ